MSERRLIERLSPLVIRTEFPCGEDSRHGYMTNLSEAGAFLATVEELNVGQILQAHFYLPWGLGEHQATATVVWRSMDMDHDPGSVPRGVGLQFSELRTDTKEAIRRYMQKFFDILAQIEEHGLNQILMKLSSERSESVH